MAPGASRAWRVEHLGLPAQVEHGAWRVSGSLRQSSTAHGAWSTSGLLESLRPAPREPCTASVSELLEMEIGWRQLQLVRSDDGLLDDGVGHTGWLVLDQRLNRNPDGPTTEA